MAKVVNESEMKLKPVFLITILLIAVIIILIFGYGYIHRSPYELNKQELAQFTIRVNVALLLQKGGNVAGAWLKHQECML